MSGQIRLPKIFSTKRDEMTPRDFGIEDSSLFFEKSLSSFRKDVKRKGGTKGERKTYFLKPSTSISSFSKDENVNLMNESRVQELWKEQVNKRSALDLTSERVEREIVDFDEIMNNLDRNMRELTNEPSRKQNLDNNNDEDEDEDELNPQKFRKKKRFRPVLVLIKDSVEKNVDQLMKHPEKMKKLKRQIEKYESQNTMFGKRLKSKNLIQKNINETKRYQEKQRKKQKEYFLHRRELHKWAKYNRTRIQNTQIERTEKEKRQYERKYAAARRVKESLPAKIMDMEKKQKWSFIISLYSRFFILYDALEKKREEEEEKKRRMELTRIVFQKMMPIVREGRHKQWIESWGRFKRHWYFFKLWIQVKKKKEAIRVIKSFMKSTGIDFTFVKRVNSFRQNIRKSQYYVKKYQNAEKTRLMILTMKYTVVESKMILDRTLDKKRIRFVLKNENGIQKELFLGVNHHHHHHNSNKRYSATASSSSSSSSSFSAFNSSGGGKDSSSSSSSFYDKYVKPLGSGPIAQIRPSLKERMDLICQYMDEKKREYLTVYPIFKKNLIEYREKVQEQECMDKATRLLDRNNDDDEEEEEEEEEEEKNKKKEKEEDEKEKKEVGVLYDSSGNIIPEPKEPFLRCFISDNEMKKLVKTGFKRIREKEEELFRNLREKNANFKNSLEKEKLNFIKQDHDLLDKLESFFGTKYEERRKLFQLATKRVNDIRKQRSYLHLSEIRLKEKY